MSLSKGMAVMVTLRFCTLKIGGEFTSGVVMESFVSHLWFKHSETLGRFLKGEKTQ